MRKLVITNEAAAKHIEGDEWLDLEKIAGVEMTSEDPAFPIEGALAEDGTTGWRAAATGPQIVRILF
ncbi:MAG TPA: hypothetical protein VIX90_01965, partial [Edaphobacter sp.]